MPKTSKNECIVTFHNNVPEASRDKIKSGSKNIINSYTKLGESLNKQYEVYFKYDSADPPNLAVSVRLILLAAP